MSKYDNLLTFEEWEKLCDCCGMCCMFKVLDDETEEVLATSLACPLLNTATGKCRSYADRGEKNPFCTFITPENLDELAENMPYHCGYRCVAEGRKLPKWHPVNRDNSVEARTIRKKLEPICTTECGEAVSFADVADFVAGCTVSETLEPDDDMLEEHIIEI